MPNERNRIIHMKYLLLISIKNKIIDSLIGATDFDFSSIECLISQHLIYLHAIIDFFFFNFYLFIFIFLVVLGLHFCARAFSSCGKRGPLFIAVRGPLTIAASLVAEHRLQTRRLSNCGSRA